MLLVEQKANILLSKITFAEKRLEELTSLDEILGTYVKDLADRLNTLKNQIGIAQSEFREFIEETGFGESNYLRATSQQRLLKDMLRSYEEIEQSFYLGVDTFLPLIPIWIHQRHDENTRRAHKLLVNFIQGLLEISAVPGGVMTILGETYECLPLFWEDVTKHVIFATFSEMQSLQRWVLLTHEIGHAFYDLNFEEFNSSVIPQVVRKILERRPSNIGERDLENIIYVWARKWVPELVSDCFSVKTLGPSYVIQFMLMALDSEPDHIDVTHPPNNLRVSFMMELLDSLKLPDFNIDFYRDVWNSYSQSITQPSSQYILDEKVVEVALTGINSVVSATPIRNKWAEILSTRESLSGGNMPDKDLLSILAASALLDPSISSDWLYDELLERYTSGSDAP